MFERFEERSQRWRLRGLRRRAHRRPAPPTAPRIVSAASLVDAYHAGLGPASNDAVAAPSRPRPVLTIVGR